MRFWLLLSLSVAEIEEWSSSEQHSSPTFALIDQFFHLESPLEQKASYNLLDY